MENLSKYDFKVLKEMYKNGKGRLSPLYFIFDNQLKTFASERNISYYPYSPRFCYVSPLLIAYQDVLGRDRYILTLGNSDSFIDDNIDFYLQTQDFYEKFKDEKCSNLFLGKTLGEVFGKYDKAIKEDVNIALQYLIENNNEKISFLTEIFGFLKNNVREENYLKFKHAITPFLKGKYKNISFNKDLTNLDINLELLINKDKFPTNTDLFSQIISQYNIPLRRKSQALSRDFIIGYKKKFIE